MLIEVAVTSAVDTFSDAVWLEGDGNKTGKTSRVEINAGNGTACVRKIKQGTETALWEFEFDGVKALEVPVAGWYKIGMKAGGFVSSTVVTLEG